MFSKLKTGETPALAPIVTTVEAMIRDRKIARGEDPGPQLAAPAAPVRRQPGQGRAAAGAQGQGSGKGSGKGKGAAKDLDEVAAEEETELRRAAE